MLPQRRARREVHDGSVASTIVARQATVETGTLVGPYQILEPLGAGGMGAVYRALDTRLQRQVAVKVLPPALAGDSDLLRRFEQEARAVGAISHPNILAVFDVGTHDGVPYMVTELLEGETLRARLREGALPVRKAVEIAMQIARGLAAAHERGFVHRDLKPDNVFLTTDGLVKILDFGLAKLARGAVADEAGSQLATAPAATAPGVVMGTVGYMAPEQLRGQAVDFRADVFAFGAVLYEMLTGRRAFSGETVADTITAILREDPPELASLGRHLPAGLERMLARCLEKEPEERFQSARDLAFALEALALTSGPSASRLPRPGGRRVALAGVAAAAALVVGGVVGFVVGRRVAGSGVPTFQQLTFRRGTIAAARFAPDGATAYYTASWDGKPSETFAVRLDSRESQPLGLGRARILAAGAGDLVVMLMGGGSPMGTVALAPLGPGAPRPVAEEIYDADRNPRSGELAIVHEVEGKARLEYPIGHELLTAEGWMQDPRIAPDGTRVAVVHHPVFGDTRGSVVIVERGKRRQVRSSEWKDIGGLAWSPDGKAVWFSATSRGADRAIRVMTVGGAERLAVQAPGRLVLHDVAPGPKLLASRSVARREARGVLPGGEGERDFTWLDGTYVADLSADGTTILFGESAEGGGPGYSVFLRQADGAPPVRLGEGLAFSLSPDRRWALTLRPGEPPALVLLPTGAGQPVTLPRGAMARYHWACWFPDGRRILVVGNEAGEGTRLFVQETPDGLPRPVGPEGVIAFRWNAITPDGSALAAGCPREIPAPVCLIPLDGGPPRPLRGVPPGNQPIRWSADGRWLFLRGPRAELPVRIRRLDTVSGTVEAWGEVGPKDVAGVSTVSDVLLTPDGRYYLYHFQRSLSDLFVVNGVR